MDDQDREHLIDDESEASDERPDEQSSDDNPRIKKPHRTVIVEPVFLLYTLAMMGASPTLTQYMYARIAKGYPVLTNSTHHTGGTTENDTSDICNNNHSSATYIATESVQSETAQWNMYFQLCSSILAMCTTLFYGAYSDRVGRRFVLLMPCLSNVCRLVIASFVIYFNLPLYIILFGSALDGLSGSYTTMIMAVFSYIADTTSKEQRGFRIAIVEACMVLSNAAAQLGTGYFIKAAGFLWPYVTMAIIMVINLLYIFFFVPETVIRDRENKKGFSMSQSFRKTYRLYTMAENRRNVKLILICSMVFTFFLSYGGRFMLTLYLMNVPFCWGSVLIGTFSAASSLVSQVCGIGGLKILKWFKVREIWIAAIGVVSSVGGLVLTAFATNNLMLYMVCVVNFMYVLPMPMFRALLSCLVKPDEQGTAFAGIACIEEICTLMISLLYATIYQATLFFMPGFIFLVSASFGFLCLILIGIYRMVERRHPGKELTTLSSEDAKELHSPLYRSYSSAGGHTGCVGRLVVRWRSRTPFHRDPRTSVN